MQISLLFRTLQQRKFAQTLWCNSNTMKRAVVEISIYDKREMSTSTFAAEQLSENKFRMIDNDVFNCRLTKGTEFKTRFNRF